MVTVPGPFTRKRLLQLIDDGVKMFREIADRDPVITLTKDAYNLLTPEDAMRYANNGVTIKILIKVSKNKEDEADFVKEE